jgi:phage-related protein
METLQTTKAHFSIPSLIALVSAIASFAVSPGAGFLLAVVAVVAGVLGIVLSMSPNIRGGLVSMFSLIVAAIGIVVAIARALTSLL